MAKRDGQTTGNDRLLDYMQKLFLRGTTYSTQVRLLTQYVSIPKALKQDGWYYCFTLLIQDSSEQANTIPCKKLEPPDPGTYKPEFPPRYASWPHFSRVFMVSATLNDGVDEVRDFLKEQSRDGIWECRPEFIYNQKPKELVEDIARERLLDNLRDEVCEKLQKSSTISFGY